MTIVNKNHDCHPEQSEGPTPDSRLIKIRPHLIEALM
jgi:hypothetical protein